MGVVKINELNRRNYIIIELYKMIESIRVFEPSSEYCYTGLNIEELYRKSLKDIEQMYEVLKKEFRRVIK